MRTHQRIPCLLLFAAVLALTAVSAFQALMPSSGISRGRTMIKSGKTILRADAEGDASSATAAPTAADAPAAEAPAADAPAAEAPAADASTSSSASPSPVKQSEYGKSLELPQTYASCGQCGASFALTLEAMGPGKGGRYVTNAKKKVPTPLEIYLATKESTTTTDHEPYQRGNRFRKNVLSK
jgi:pyruvate/2-oxoglutarate dehydrogenase complex dihydrolipoamide acyltransferase (E2) component